MWKDKPSAEEVASWFKNVDLFEGADPAKYVGGIVAIENFQTKQWNPFVLAATRIAYFWDWVEANSYTATIETSDPTPLEMPFAPNAAGDGYLVAQSLFVAATVTVRDPSKRTDADPAGIVIRESTGRKQVSLNLKIKRGTVTIPNYDATMKAETGAIARAVGQIGMLALPGSGIASAEDMYDFLREQDEGGSDGGQQQEPKGRRAPSPKQQVAT